MAKPAEAQLRDYQGEPHAPPSLSVRDDPAYEIKRVDLVHDVELANGGMANSFSAGGMFDIRRIGNNFEVREKGVAGVLVLHPAGVRIERWGPKAGVAKEPITAPEVARV